MSNIIDVNQVSYHYRSKKALDKVSFTVKQGEFAALLGPNGAGKTTLFSLLSQFLVPQSGEIHYHHQQQAVFGRQAFRQIGFVFQQTTLDLDLTVEQNLHYHASLSGISRQKAKQRIVQELERMEMADRLKDKVRSLNGGHKRRVEIARALLHEPSILLLDEPTVGLDMPTREHINKYIRRLCKEQATTVLWTTHLIDEINTRDHVILLDKGKIKLDGQCQQLLDENNLDNLRELFVSQADINLADINQ